MTSAWTAILAAGAATQVLRYLPLWLLHGSNRRMPAAAARMLEYAGWATLGGLIASAVFRREAGPSVGIPPEAAVKGIALTAAFLFYLLSRKSMLSLILGYATYLCLILARSC